MNEPLRPTPSNDEAVVPQGAPRKKRHFSAEGLAAVCANLEKARADMVAHGPTPRQIAARRASMRKLNARADADKAFKARKYRPTARRLAANRATIKIAQATPRAPESWNPSRYNALKHGLYVHSFEETLAKLGESPPGIPELRRAPGARLPGAGRLGAAGREAPGRGLVAPPAALQGPGALRNRRPQPHFELRVAARAVIPTHLRTLGLLLMQSLLSRPGLAHAEDRLVCLVERRIRALLKLVVGGDPKFRIFTREARRRTNIEKRLEQEIEQNERLIELHERLRAGDPVANQVLQETVAKLEKALVPLEAILRW